MLKYFALLLFTLIPINVHALECSDEQWKQCNDSLGCLESLGGSCGSYISRLKSCPVCQSHDNESDTLKCFSEKNC
jgi:hypothetical protein